MNHANDLHRLEERHRSGALSDEEYAREREALLRGSPPPEVVPAGGEPTTADLQTRLWAMILHFSQFAGYVVPLAGMVVPIVIWQIKKTELPGLDEHGKVVTNWIISEIIYAVICVFLAFVIVGIPLLIILGVLGIVFPIIGGIKANEGKLWKYPLAIAFFK